MMLLLGSCTIASYGQEDEPVRYIQVSGIIVDISGRPVPGVSVISIKLRRATVSEPTGIYSITSTQGDTIYFRAVGYKRYHTVIPENYTDRLAKADIILETDTIEIEPVTILPWRNYSEFLRDITKERPVDPITENMKDNIESIYVALANESGVRISPEAGYRYSMNQNFNGMATRQQYPVNNLLNPFAWAKFVEGIKNGLFKNQNFNKPVRSKVRKKKN